MTTPPNPEHPAHNASSEHAAPSHDGPHAAPAPLEPSPLSELVARERIRPRERDAILQTMRVGEVPAIGLRHIQVGRDGEVAALINDVDRIVDGGSAIRFLVGNNGDGKTFLAHLARSIAAERGLVTAHADLSPDLRLHSTSGQARALYAALMASVSIRAQPDGGALESIVETFIINCLGEAEDHGGDVNHAIRQRLARLEELPGGYDFAQVITAYRRCHDTGNDQLQRDALRWLRAEYTTKRDARDALGVRTIIDDANFYDHLRLFARFVRLAGYAGLLIGLDEVVSLHRLSNPQARGSNYEQLLRILNDTLQSTSVGLGFVFGVTPETVLDPRRGFYSNNALKTRLSPNRFLRDGLVDFSGPLIHLAPLTAEDLHLVLIRLRHVHASGDPDRYVVPDEALHAFQQHLATRIGAAYFRTPRDTIRAFLDLLAIVEQNPTVDWSDMIERVEITTPPLPITTPADESPDSDTAFPPNVGSTTAPPPNPERDDDRGDNDEGDDGDGLVTLAI